MSGGRKALKAYAHFQKTMRMALKVLPHPLTVYIEGHIKGYI